MGSRFGPSHVNPEWIGNVLRRHLPYTRLLPASAGDELPRYVLATSRMGVSHTVCAGEGRQRNSCRPPPLSGIRELHQKSNLKFDDDDSSFKELKDLGSPVPSPPLSGKRDGMVTVEEKG